MLLTQIAILERFVQSLRSTPPTVAMVGGRGAIALGAAATEVADDDREVSREEFGEELITGEVAKRVPTRF